MATINELIPAFNAFTQTALSIADRKRQELKEIELKQKEIEGFEFVSKLAESFEGKTYEDFKTLEQDFTSAMKTIYATKNPIAIQNGLSTLNAMYQQKSNYIKEAQERRLGEADLTSLNLLYGSRKLDNPLTPEFDETYSISDLMNLPQFKNLTPAQRASAVSRLAPELAVQESTVAMPDTESGGIVVTKKKYSKVNPEGKFKTEKYVIKNGQKMSVSTDGKLTLADGSQFTPEETKAFLDRQKMDTEERRGLLQEELTKLNIQKARTGLDQDENFKKDPTKALNALSYYRMNAGNKVATAVESLLKSNKYYQELYAQHVYGDKDKKIKIGYDKVEKGLYVYDGDAEGLDEETYHTAGTLLKDDKGFINERLLGLMVEKIKEKEKTIGLTAGEQLILDNWDQFWNLGQESLKITEDYLQSLMPNSIKINKDNRESSGHFTPKTK